MLSLVGGNCKLLSLWADAFGGIVFLYSSIRVSEKNNGETRGEIPGSRSHTHASCGETAGAASFSRDSDFSWDSTFSCNSAILWEQPYLRTVQRKDNSMNRIILSVLMLGLSLAPVLCWAAEPNADQAKAIAEIEKLGGTVTVDEKSPDKPVVVRESAKDKGDRCWVGAS